MSESGREASRCRTISEALEVDTYGEPVLLVGRGSSWGELRGVGGCELQAVALHRARLRHGSQQGLQGRVLLLS